MIKQIYRLILFVLPFYAHAQIETTLPHLTRLHQATYTNPAILPAYSNSFSTPLFPGVSVNMGLYGMTPKTLTGNIDTGGFFNVNGFYDDIKGDFIGTEVNSAVEIFHIRFKGKNWYYGISLQNRTIMDLRISKEFIGFAAYGNEYFAGRTLDASSSEIKVLAFNELGFSMARSYNRLNVGARVKLYQGLGAAEARNLTLTYKQPEIATGDIVVRMTGVMRTSGIPSIRDTVNGSPATEADTTFDMSKDALFRTANLGTGIDLGFTYNVNSRLTVGASILDLGFISWSNQAFKYKMKDVDVKYNGITYEQFTSDTSALERALDSLENLLKPDATRENFTTAMPVRFFLSGSYELNKRNTISAFIQGRTLNTRLLMAYSLGYTKRFGSNFDLTANYSINGKGYSGLGLGMAVKWGAFQIYAMTDNVLSYTDIPSLEKLSLRFGLNIVWGEIRRPLKVY